MKAVIMIHMLGQESCNSNLSKLEIKAL